MQQDRLRVVVVGLNFGRWLIERELLTGEGLRSCQLLGVCDLDTTKSEALAAQYDVTAYPDFDAVLADPEVDAVVLTVGPAGRAELVLRAVDAGKAVMTTKPFEVSSALALDALTAAEKAGVPVFLNSPTTVPELDMQTIAEWIDTYDLGRSVAYRASTWVTYREQSDGTWYDDPELCPAAPITRLGIYLLNDLFRFLPAVRDITVQESRLFTGRPTSDNAQLALVHEDGTLGTVFASFGIGDGQPYQRSMELNFERGTIYRNVGVVPSDDQNLVRLGLSAMVDGERVVESVEVEQSEAGYQWELFRRACRGEDIGPRVTPEQVAAAVGVLERIRPQHG